MDKTTVRFKVEGLAFWAYGEEKYESGIHEVQADKELAKAITDASNAKVGVQVMKGKVS